MQSSRCFEVELQDKNNNIFTGIVVISISIFDWAKQNNFVVRELFGFLPALPTQATKLNKKANFVSGFRARVGAVKTISAGKIDHG